MSMNWLTTMNGALAKKMAKTELKLRKKSPEILLAAGVAGFVGTVVMACKATLRADEVLEYHNAKMKSIHEAKQIADQNPEEELEYDDSLYRQDVAVQCLKTTGKMAKLYAPAIAMGVVSVACILTSRNIMQKRYLGVLAAYESLSTIFNEYRARVREEQGELMDRHYRYGTKIDTLNVVNVDEEGKKTKEKVTVEDIPSEIVNTADDTSRFFDQDNPNWNSNPAFSMMFLRGVQNMLNDKLHTNGHLFLNEVYDALGYDDTPQGAILGWIEGEGDDCVDFGLYDRDNEATRRFVNGVDNVILLTFNHCGVIWNKI